MSPKLFQTARALYTVEPWDGQNLSGLKPISNLVLIRADECAPFTAGGLSLTDEVRENNSLASETGVIVAVGSAAFKFTVGGRPWSDDDPEKPKPGDRVWFQRYSGSEHNGYDKKLYRMMNDTVIGGIFDMEHAPFIPWPENYATEWQFPSISEVGESMPIDGAAQEEVTNG